MSVYNVVQRTVELGFETPGFSMHELWLHSESQFRLNKYKFS